MRFLPCGSDSRHDAGGIVLNEAGDRPARTADRDLEKTAVGARTCFPGRVVVVKKAEIGTRVLGDIEIGTFDPCLRLLCSLPAPGFDHSVLFWT